MIELRWIVRGKKSGLTLSRCWKLREQKASGDCGDEYCRSRHCGGWQYEHREWSYSLVTVFSSEIKPKRKLDTSLQTMKSSHQPTSHQSLLDPLGDGLVEVPLVAPGHILLLFRAIITTGIWPKLSKEVFYDLLQHAERLLGLQARCPCPWKAELLPMRAKLMDLLKVLDLSSPAVQMARASRAAW